MVKKRRIPSLWLCFILLLMASGAFAWGARNSGGNHGSHGYRGNGGYSYGGNGYRGHGGHGYGGHGYRGFGGYFYDRYVYPGCEFWPYGAVDFNVMDPPIGSIYSYIPNGANLIVVDGTGYYYLNGYYLRPCPAGYMVVTPPEVAAPSVPDSKAASQPLPASDNGAMVNIPNSKGGFTTVKLAKVKDGYTGPQGEFYAGHPTVDELRVLYGD
jgi:hypothetical protein